LIGDGRVIKFMEELSLMKETTTKDVIHRFMLQIYILTVMITFLKCCFVIDQETIGYVIDSISAVEFQTYIFDIV
jgi:hypothetical protein